ncbi:hypothetical protein GGQ79_004558 [Ochrobactrum pecoris]|uniref:Secreted protein n=1 Tax=Brucella pecoris TaxID=867683 RepID=A0AB34YZ11_9HYPH|nr:hypothetical protein [Brucella pecoris]
MCRYQPLSTLVYLRMCFQFFLTECSRRWLAICSLFSSGACRLMQRALNGSRSFDFRTVSPIWGAFICFLRAGGWRGGSKLESQFHVWFLLAFNSALSSKVNRSHNKLEFVSETVAFKTSPYYFLYGLGRSAPTTNGTSGHASRYFPKVVTPYALLSESVIIPMTNKRRNLSFYWPAT